MNNLLQSNNQQKYLAINKAAEIIGVPAYVLRFWESKFKQIKPTKINGRRYYTDHDISIIMKIKTLLYDHGYTINGVISILEEGDSTIEKVNNDPVDAHDLIGIKNKLNSIYLKLLEE